MSIVAVFNQKGGVGKTTTTFNLTAALARVGRRPVAIDLDPQAHLSLAMGVRNVAGAQSVFGFFQNATPLGMLTREVPPGIELLPASADLSKIDALHGSDAGITRRLRAGIEEAGWATSAPVMMDCSPMLGVLTLNALMAADRVLIPLAADFLSLQGVYRITTALDVLEKKTGRPFLRRIVVSRYDARRKLSFQIYRELQANFPGIVCETRIHESVALAESPMHAKDIFAFAPSSQGATDFRMLVQELDAAGFFAVPG
ncbi:MAG: ParA family protein [Betaproteobacteria bacterium]